MTRVCLILVIGLIGLPRLLMAADPFQVSVRLVSSSSPSAITGDRSARNVAYNVSGGRQTTEDRRQVLSVQVEVPNHHKLYADQFRVEVPAPASLIPRFLLEPEKQADPLRGVNTLVFTRSFQALYAIENLNTNPLPVTVWWQGCNATICFLPAKKTFLVSWADRESFSDTVPAVNSAAFASTTPAYNAMRKIGVSPNILTTLLNYQIAFSLFSNRVLSWLSSRSRPSSTARTARVTLISCPICNSLLTQQFRTVVLRLNSHAKICLRLSDLFNWFNISSVSPKIAFPFFNICLAILSPWFSSSCPL